MKQQLKLQDALEILKEKADTASLEEIEVISDLAMRMNGTKRQRIQVNDLYRDIMVQRAYIKSQAC